MSEYGIYLDSNNTLPDNTAHIGNHSTEYRNQIFNSNNIIYHNYAYHSGRLSYQNELVYGIQHISYDGYIADVINTVPTNLTNSTTDYGVKIDNYELTYLSNNMFCHSYTIDCVSNQNVPITLSPRALFVVEFLNESTMRIKQNNRHNFTVSFIANRRDYSTLCAKINVYEAKKNHISADYGIYVNDSNINSTFISSVNNINVTNVEPDNTEYYKKYINAASGKEAGGKIHFVFYKRWNNKLLLNSARILTADYLIYDGNNIVYTCGEMPYSIDDDTSGDTWHNMPYNNVLDIN